MRPVSDFFKVHVDDLDNARALANGPFYWCWNGILARAECVVVTDTGADLFVQAARPLAISVSSHDLFNAAITTVVFRKQLCHQIYANVGTFLTDSLGSRRCVEVDALRIEQRITEHLGSGGTATHGDWVIPSPLAGFLIQQSELRTQSGE